MAGKASPQREAAYKLFAAGERNYIIARQLGVPPSTVQTWRENWKLEGQVEPPPHISKANLQEMELAAVKAKLRVLEQVRPNVIPAYLAPTQSSPEARWKAAEVDNAERIQRCLLMAKFSVELPNEPCAITFISDQHISIGNCVDLQRMREDAEMVSQTDGCYAVLGGDAVDNHCKHRAAVLAARSQPSDQWELMEWYLSIFAERILVAISGNHEAFTVQLSGSDVLSILLKKSRICYSPDEALIDVLVGGQPYKVGVRHQFRMNSSFNETHACKQWFRLGEETWDVGVIGHNHVAAVESFYAHGIERWAIRPGSYQITSAYSRQYGYNKTCPRCPTVIFYPDRREMVAFHDIRPALRMLKAERG